MPRRIVVGGIALGAIVLLAGFVVIACAAGPGSALTGWDTRVTETLIGRRTSDWSRTLWAFTLLGNTPILSALVGSVVVLLAAWGRRSRAALMAVGLLAAQWISNLAKWAVGRARPSETLALIKQPDSHGLPSGHALLSLVFCGLLVYVAFAWVDGDGRARNCVAAGSLASGVRSPAARWAAKAAVLLVAAVVVAFVGLSRVYLGVHWASDVLAGWCLGGAWLGAVVGVVLWRRSSRSGDGGGAAGRPHGLRRRLPVRGRVLLLVVVLLAVVVATLLTARVDPLLM